MQNTFRDSRIKATYRGTVLGWFDSAAEANAAIDAARTEEENEDQAFADSRRRLRHSHILQFEQLAFSTEIVSVEIGEASSRTV